MNDKQVDIELAKMEESRQQWHDDFLQREKHWFWERGFWLVMAGLAGGAFITKILN